MKMSRYLGATALLLVLGAPAYAQSSIEQLAGPGLNQGTFNSNIVTVPGVVGNAVAGQTGTNDANVTGSILDPISVTSPFLIQQGASGVNQDASNIIAANGFGPAVSNIQAGGFQGASNTMNSANVAAFGVSTGTLIQSANGVSMDANNAMSAVVNNGNATVGGTNFNGGPGYQQAFGSLNTASVYVGGTLVGPGVLSIDTTQKFGSGIEISATNSALANSVASGSALLDPTVQNLNQTAAVSVTQLSFSAPANSTALVNLHGGQAVTSGDRLEIVGGNTAVAYTGDTIAPLYGIGSTTGNGIALVTGVTQNASFSLNGVNGGAGVSVALSGAADIITNPTGAFQQSVDGGGLSIATPSGSGALVNPGFLGAYVVGDNVINGVVNGMAASTNTGSASVVGAARTLSSDPFTQAFSNQQNSINVGGTLSGAGSQSLVNSDPTFAANVALASAEVGPASLTNVSQSGRQSFNSAYAGSADGLNLSQNANPMLVVTGNAQVALGSTTGTISGAQQAATSGVNTMGFGTSATNSTLDQSATGVNLVNGNVLAATGSNNASITNSVQYAAGSLNVVGAGVGVTGTLSQTSSLSNLTSANIATTSSSLNATQVVMQTSTNSTNVVK